MLVETENIAGRVFKKSGDLARFGLRGLDNYSSLPEDKVARCNCVIAHDIDKRSIDRIFSRNPHSAHLPYPVVEGDPSVVPFPDFPVEDVPVEGGGSFDIDCGEYQITDFTVTNGGGHGRWRVLF